MKRVLAIAMFVSLGALAHAASANTITYDFAGTPGFTGGLPLSVSATFTTLANGVQISITNNQANPTSVIQNLSDLVFTLSTGQNSGSIVSSSGVERTVNGDNDKTFTAGSAVSTGWALSTNGAGLELNVLGTAIGPAHTLIGPPDGSNLYSNANGSIAGNGPHNPFLIGPIAFDLSILDVTAASNITSATFSFGTTDGNDAPGTPSPAPEPATLFLLGSSMVGLGLARWRRGRQH